MAKKTQLKSKNISFPAAVLGTEFLLMGIDANINFRYKERTHIAGDIQIDSEEKNDYVQINGQFQNEEQLEQLVAENPLLALAIEKAKEKATKHLVEMAEKIAQAQSGAVSQTKEAAK